MPPTHLSSACASHTEEFPPALSPEELHTNSLKALKSINPTICDAHGSDVHDLPIALRKNKVWNTSYSFDYHFLLIRWNVKCCQEPATLRHPPIVRHTHTKKAQQILPKFCMLLLEKKKLKKKSCSVSYCLNNLVLLPSPGKVHSIPNGHSYCSLQERSEQV